CAAPASAPLYAPSLHDALPIYRGTASRPNLLVNNASHTRYVNLTLHDGGIGFFSYPNRADVEVSGCIVYNNGWSVGTVGNGHGLDRKSTRLNSSHSQISYAVFC